ncbi:MAG TPA: hypothetical protein VGM19_06295 [Armatimonadota bacterium]|jgi:hypothetical protein
MSRLISLIALLALLTVASVACADVTIGMPTAGSTVGPSTAVTGMCSQRAFLVVYSEVIDANNVPIGTVPGIRHWTNDNNSFGVRISTPRLLSQADEHLTYEIHVKAYSHAPKSMDDAPDLGEAQVSVDSH